MSHHPHDLLITLSYGNGLIYLECCGCYGNEIIIVIIAYDILTLCCVTKSIICIFSHMMLVMGLQHNVASQVFVIYIIRPKSTNQHTIAMAEKANYNVKRSTINACIDFENRSSES